MAEKKTMWKGLFVPILVLLILVGGYLVIHAIQQHSAAAKAEADAAATRILADCTINKISYTNGETTLNFAKGGDEWCDADDVNFPLEQSALDSMEDTLQNLSWQRRLTEVDSLVDYGLTAPTDTITFFCEDGVQKTLYLGSTASDGSTYLYCGDDPATVYTVDDTLKNSLNYRLYDMVRYTSFPTVSSSDISEITLPGENGAIPYTRKQQMNQSSTSEGDVAVGLESSWYHANEQLSEDKQSILDAIATQLSGLSFSGCVDYSADDNELAAYGLDDPLTLSFQSSSATVTLAIGSLEEESGCYYATLNGKNEVVLVNQDFVAALRQNIEDL